MMLSTSELYQICMKIYENVSVPVSWFVLPLFLIRVSVAQLSGDSAEIRAALKGLVMYFVLILSFGMILDLLLQIPQSFIPDVTTEVISAKTSQLAQQEKSALEVALRTTPEIISYFGECILAGIYWAMVILHVLVMVLMTAMAPVIFLLGCVGNIGVPVRVFFGLIIMSSCWPALWFGFDQALPYIEKVIPNDFGKLVLSILLNAFKAIAPFTIAYMSLNSGPGKAAVMAINHLLDLSKNGTSKAGGAIAEGANSAAKFGYIKYQSSRAKSAESSLQKDAASRAVEAQAQENSGTDGESLKSSSASNSSNLSSRTDRDNSSSESLNRSTIEQTSSSVGSDPVIQTEMPSSSTAPVNAGPVGGNGGLNQPNNQSVHHAKPSVPRSQEQIQTSGTEQPEKLQFHARKMNFVDPSTTTTTPKPNPSIERNRNGEV